jgi:outer membrane protein OmpA-like peptidoglycan-associated protein
MLARRHSGATRGDPVKHPCLLLLLAAAAPSAALAHEGGFDAHNFQLYAADGQPVAPLVVASPFVTKGFFAAGVFEYAKSPLVAVPASSDGTLDFTEAEALLDDVVALNLNLGWAPARFARIDVGLPLFLSSTGHEGANGFAAGDIKVGGTLGWSKEEQRGFGVGLSPYVTIPLGATSAYLGQSGVAGGADLGLGYHGEKLLVAASAGYAYAPDFTLGNLTGADHINVGAIIGYEVVEHFGINLEGRAALPLGVEAVPGTDTPAELLVHGKYQLTSGLNFLAGGAGGLSGGAGTPAYRVFLGVGYGPVFKKGPPPPPPDLDKDDDGINDDVDACVDQPETVNGYKDADGCPDGIGGLTVTTSVDGKPVAGSITLTGGGGVLTGAKTVTVEKAEPGSEWSAKGQFLCYTGEAKTTAKEGDTALDVALSAVLGSKAAVEVVDKKGKAVDGATVKWDTEASMGCVPGGGPAKLEGGKATIPVGVGKHRVFVTAPDMTNYSGEFQFALDQTTDIRVELATTKIKLEAKQIVILDKVFFETNSDVIKAESFKLLDEVGSVIMANPQVGRVEVSGHTDSDGDDASNLDLSQRRADSVKRYLEGKGVKAERLIAKGFGETKPIAKNTSSKGKATNRRVEFNLIEQAKPADAIETKPAEGAPTAPASTPPAGK